MSTAAHPLILPRREAGQPGWRPQISRRAGQDHVTASITCPVCRRSFVLDTLKVGIQLDGLVQPAAECPRHGCPWAEVVILEGWRDLVAPVLIGGRDVPEEDPEPPDNGGDR